MRVNRKIVREALWDCSQCYRTRIPGRTTICPGCGKPHDPVLNPTEKWYLPKNSPIITDSGVLAKADLPSWSCGNCNELNVGDAVKCIHCDEPLGFNDTIHRRVTYDNLAKRFDIAPDPRDEMIESDLAKAQRTLDTAAEGPRHMGDLTLPESEKPAIGPVTEFNEAIREEADRRFNERMGVNGLPSIMQKLYPFHRAIIIGIVVLIVIGIVTSIVSAVSYLTATVPGTVTISELHWKRSVEVEELKTLTDEGWNYPGDAQIVSTDRKIRSYNTVHDGWTIEEYIEHETGYRVETYPGTKTVTESEDYDYDCSYSTDNGNGTFTDVDRTCTGTHRVSHEEPMQLERQVPYDIPHPRTRQVEITHQEAVYDTWYTYEIDRWASDRWVSISDEESNVVTWPVPSDLSRDEQPGDQVGEERVGDGRSESYRLTYTDAQGSGHSEECDEVLWNKLEAGESVPAFYYERNGQLSSVDWKAVS